MKWKRRRPEDKEERTIKYFAWLPIKLDNDYYIWLESYYKLQSYRRSSFIDDYWLTLKVFQNENK